jgi:hypothetical protein
MHYPKNVAQNFEPETFARVAPMRRAPALLETLVTLTKKNYQKVGGVRPIRCFRAQNALSRPDGKMSE